MWTWHRKPIVTEAHIEVVDVQSMAKRLVELDELYTKFQMVSEYTPERLLELFMAGYELRPPEQTAGVVALKRGIKKSPHPDGDKNILACWCCGSGEYLYNEDGNRNDFCGQCGQRIDWSTDNK